MSAHSMNCTGRRIPSGKDLDLVSEADTRIKAERDAASSLHSLSSEAAN